MVAVWGIWCPRGDECRKKNSMVAKALSEEDAKARLAQHLHAAPAHGHLSWEDAELDASLAEVATWEEDDAQEEATTDAGGTASGDSRKRARGGGGGGGHVGSSGSGGTNLSPAVMSSIQQAVAVIIQAHIVENGVRTSVFDPLNPSFVAIG